MIESLAANKNYIYYGFSITWEIFMISKYRTENFIYTILFLFKIGKFTYSSK